MAKKYHDRVIILAQQSLMTKSTDAARRLDPCLPVFDHLYGYGVHVNGKPVTVAAIFLSGPVIDEYIQTGDPGIRHTEGIIPFFAQAERNSSVPLPDFISGSIPGGIDRDQRLRRPPKTFDRNSIPYQAPGFGIQPPLAKSFIVPEEIEFER
jgi:hypothetical protein